MRFMVIVKSTPETEREGALPDPQLLLCEDALRDPVPRRLNGICGRGPELALGKESCSFES
jgi:hypothetical protein